VLIGLITRAKKLKDALNRLVQNIWSKMDLEELGTSKEHERQPLIHLIQVQKSPIYVEQRADVSSPIPTLLGLFFVMI